jgi:hypothetical protein
MTKIPNGVPGGETTRVNELEVKPTHGVVGDWVRCGASQERLYRVFLLKEFSKKLALPKMIY